MKPLPAVRRLPADGSASGAHAPAGTSTIAPKRRVIGGVTLVFFVVAAVAPLTSIVALAPIGLLVGGEALPVGYLIPGVLYIIFAAGFTAMSRHVTVGGAFCAYISAGLGRLTGAGSALMAYIGYLALQIAFVSSAGKFLSVLIDNYAGADIPWWLSALFISFLITVIGYRRIDTSARLLVVLMTLEVAILSVFCVAVLLRGGYEGLSLGNIFNPAVVFTPALGAVMIITCTAFVGFEQTAIYSEEVKDPRRTISRATYIAIITITLLFAFCAWVIQQAAGSRLFELLSGDPGLLIYTLNSEFAGVAMTRVMQLLVVTSFIAGCLAAHNSASRYLLMMGRTRVLPQTLGRISPKTGSPGTAGVVQGSLVTAGIIAFALWGGRPHH